jgi:Zn-dependent protease
MFNSWKLGTAFGIGIFVHWTFFLLPAWVLFSNLGLGGPVLALYAVALVLAVFGCVVLHELGHALAARRFGIATRDITLYPIGGVARLERMSEKPWEEFWIAVAGPAVNVVIAGLLGAFLSMTGLVNQMVPLPSLGVDFLTYLMFINLFLAGFNMVPAFPMDGGRVLRALLALRLGHLRATEIAVGIGVFLAMVMGLVGILYFQSLSVVLIAMFVYFAGQQELAAVQQRQAHRSWSDGFNRSRPEYPEQPSSPTPSEGTVYLWDSKQGAWVEQRPLRRARPYWFEAE